MDAADAKLTRIGVFYDGGFFTHVSNYYCYEHPRKARLSVDGLHQFIREQVAKEEGVDSRYCQVVDAHYFRGRLPASVAKQRDVLMAERLWDDVLMRQGVVTHYLPVPLRDGKILGEKGIDVWFALEAFELAIYKRFNVSVLIAGDSDYVPLVRKLNTLGTRVMLLGWDFEYVDEFGEKRTTTTSVNLLDEVTYPTLMHTIIDDKTRRNDPLINNLFLHNKEGVSERHAMQATSSEEADRERHLGSIHSLKEGFGFIRPESAGTNLFFHRTELVGADFHDLSAGDPVEFSVGATEKGPAAVAIVVVSAANTEQ